MTTTRYKSPFERLLYTFRMSIQDVLDLETRRDSVSDVLIDLAIEEARERGKLTLRDGELEFGRVTYNGKDFVVEVYGDRGD